MTRHDHLELLTAEIAERAARRRRLKGALAIGAAALTVGGVALLALPSAAQDQPDSVVPAAVAPSPVADPVSAPVSESGRAAEPAPEAPARIVLEGDGFGFAADASIRRLAFGSDAATIQTVVSAALGEGTKNPCRTAALTSPSSSTARSPRGSPSSWTATRSSAGGGTARRSPPPSACGSG